MVDLTKSSALQNLLYGSGQSSVQVSDTKDYEGVAVELCHEHASENASGYFTFMVKASVQLNGTTYYTNQATGVSATGPAEEVAIKSNYGGCGVTSALAQSVTLGPDTSVNLVLYGDPTGAVYGTTAAPTNNASCVTNGSVYICSDFVSNYGTVDTAAPKIERYRVDITSHSPAVITMAFDSRGALFGAASVGIFEDNGVHPAIGTQSFKATQSGDAYVLSTLGGTPVDVFPAFQRATHSGVMNSLDESGLTYTATAL
jgi:hypothetical protein